MSPPKSPSPEELDVQIAAAKAALDALEISCRRIGGYLRIDPSGSYARAINYKPEGRHRALEVYAARDDALAVLADLRAQRSAANLAAIPDDDDELDAQIVQADAESVRLAREAKDARGHVWRLRQTKETQVQRRRDYAQAVRQLQYEAEQARQSAAKNRADRLALEPHVEAPAA